MKRKTLLLLVMISFIITANSQKKQKEKEPTTGFAITAVEKGGRNWKEVRLVNVNTGDEIKSIYQSTQETEALNARTKKPVVKKDLTPSHTSTTTTRTVTVRNVAGVQEPKPADQAVIERKIVAQKKIVNLDDELNKAQGNVNVNNNVHIRTAPTVRTVVVVSHGKMQMDKPFSTNSAAMAYDKKHERLYYTPMNINQLRYIDLKSNKIYYFEDEAFGLVKGYGDVANQITRMAIGSDGHGYALSNDGNHLIRFTTDKKQTITDLGSLTDDANNGNNSIHNPGGYGGDMIADANENLYLITANRRVFKISIETRVATFLGAIKGLPGGFSTNGAMVEEGSKVIVASSESTVGYFRFDLNTLQAERVSPEGQVFNASDLANGNLAFEKKKKDRKKEEEEVAPEETKPPVVEETARTRKPETPTTDEGTISVFPNPVTGGSAVRVSFANQPAGKYQIQLLDLSGKLIKAQEVTVSNKAQLMDFSIPDVAKGSYLVKVTGEGNRVSVTNKIVVQ